MKYKSKKKYMQLMRILKKDVRLYLIKPNKNINQLIIKMNLIKYNRIKFLYRKDQNYLLQKLSKIQIQIHYQMNKGKLNTILIII